MMATMLLRRSTIVVAPFQNRIPNNQLRRPFTCSSFVSSSRAREGTEGNRTSCASSKNPRPRWLAPLPYHRRSCFFSTVAVAASNSIDHAPAATTSESSNDPRPNVSVSDKPSSYVIQRRKGIRNVAVVAHVDHGKTTLVDQLLRLSARCVAAASQTGGATGGAGGSNSDPQVSSATASVDRVMDSGDLERERGITITSKATRMDFPGILGDEPLVVNCVDTPGHSDFSGEVDRILSMVDGVVLVVDAAEGPKSQTKYVLSRALNLGLQPLVVLNKCDRPDAVSQIDSGETEDKVRKLFHALLSGKEEGSSSSDRREELSYRTLYASAKAGWITEDPMEVLEILDDPQSMIGQDKFGMRHLVEAIVKDIPEPSIRSYQTNKNDDNSARIEMESVGKNGLELDPFSLAAVSVGYDPYLGRVCTGRIFSGSINVNDSVMLLKREMVNESGDTRGDDDGAKNVLATKEVAAPTSTISGLFVHEGVKRTPINGTAYAGDIVTIAGVPDSIGVGDTVTSKSNPVSVPIETPPLAPPTLSMDFGPNNGPLAGKEGSKVASSQVRDRLMAEADNNVTLQVRKSETDPDKTTVFARGELQLGILVETMRREGFELVISPPRILTHVCPETGKKLEPFEEVMVDVDTEYASSVVSTLTGDRKGILLESTVSPDGKTHLIFEAPSRGLLGFQSEIATATKGSAVVNHIYLGHQEYAGNLGAALNRGKLVSTAAGKATAYALGSLEQRGVLFIEPSEPVYPGMVIGQNAKQGDLEVNPVRAKEKTNIRSVAKDEKVILSPPRRHTVEELIGYMQSDELIEVTPKSVRLRKELLDTSARERAARLRAKQARSMKS